MKFWQKIYFSTLILFLVAFDLGAFVMVSYAYSFNLKRETDSGLHEQAVILSSVRNAVTNADTLFKNASKDEERLRAIVSPFAAYYKNQGVCLALYLNGKVTYSDAPEIPSEILNINKQNVQKTVTMKADGRKYLLVSSEISGYSDLLLVYVRDISGLDAFMANIGRTLAFVNLLLCALLGVSIYFLLRYLTKPVGDLNTITADIAGGALEKRVTIRSRDELGELASTFNAMANSVEDKVRQLEKSSQDKQQFIDNLAHEMRTPLTSILGYSEYLQNAVNNEEERIRAAGYLRDAAQRLQNLSTKLLDLTYARENIVFSRMDTRSLLEELRQMMEPSLTARNLKLEIFSDEALSIEGDESLLLSLLGNLVENAARASAQGDTIRVHANMAANPTLEVSDSGCGMDDAEIERITEPFYRVDKSRSRAFGGVGLGLSLCRRIAELHHAELQIESKPDAGTTVRVVFTSL